MLGTFWRCKLDYFLSLDLKPIIGCCDSRVSMIVTITIIIVVFNFSFATSCSNLFSWLEMCFFDFCLVVLGKNCCDVNQEWSHWYLYWCFATILILQASREHVGHLLNYTFMWQLAVTATCDTELLGLKASILVTIIIIRKLE